MLQGMESFHTDDVRTRAAQRPPGTLHEVYLEDSCNGCGDCVAVCPSALILLDVEGFPLLLSTSLCTSCGLCAEVCLPSAIAFTKETRAGLNSILAQQYTISEPAA